MREPERPPLGLDALAADPERALDVPPAEAQRLLLKLKPTYQT